MDHSDVGDKTDASAGAQPLPQQQIAEQSLSRPPASPAAHRVSDVSAPNRGRVRWGYTLMVVSVLLCLLAGALVLVDDRAVQTDGSSLLTPVPDMSGDANMPDVSVAGGPRRALQVSLNRAKSMLTNGRIGEAISRLKISHIGSQTSSEASAEEVLRSLILRLLDAETALAQERRELEQDKARADSLITEATAVLSQVKAAAAANAIHNFGDAVAIAQAAQDTANTAASTLVDLAGQVAAAAEGVYNVHDQQQLLEASVASLDQRSASGQNAAAGRLDGLGGAMRDLSARMGEVEAAVGVGGDGPLQQLQDRLTALETTVSRLNLDVASVGSATARLSSLPGSVSELSAAVRGVAEGVATVNASVFGGEPGTVRHDLDAATTFINGVRDEIDALRAAMLTRDDVEGAVGARAAAVEARLGELDAAVEEKLAGKLAASAHVESLRALTDLIANASGRLEGHVAEAGSRVAAVEGSLAALSAKVAAPSPTQATDALAQQELVGRLTAAEAGLSAVQLRMGAVEETASNLAESSKAVRSLASAVDSRAPAATVARLATTLAGQLSGINATVDALSLRVAALQDRMSAPTPVPVASADLDATVASLRLELAEALETTKQGLQADVSAAVASARRLSEGDADVRAALLAVNASLSSSMAELAQELRGAAESTAATVSELGVWLAGNASSVVSLGSDLADLDRDYASQFADIETLPRRVDAAASDATRVGSLVQALNGSLLSLAGKVSGLQAAVSATRSLDAAAVNATIATVTELAAAIKSVTADIARVRETQAASQPFSLQEEDLRLPSGAPAPASLLRVSAGHGSVLEGLVAPSLRSVTAPARVCDVVALLEAGLALSHADGIGLPDYALAAAGAAVLTDPTLTSATWVKGGPPVPAAAMLGPTGSLPASTDRRTPHTALEADTRAGSCWPMSGTSGSLGIKLAIPVVPSAISIDSFPGTLSILGLPENQVAGNSSALRGLLSTSSPRNISIYGLSKPSLSSRVLLDNFTFDARGPAIQTFVLPAGHTAFLGILVVFHDNYGNSRFTCVYRVRVHGAPPGYVTAASWAK